MHNEDYYAFKPIKENPIILDFSKCKYLGEIHAILKEKFGFPDYYGENWSALWDCLDGLFDNDGAVKVEIYGFGKLKYDLREYCMTMLEIFDRAHEKNQNLVFELKS